MSWLQMVLTNLTTATLVPNSMGIVGCFRKKKLPLILHSSSNIILTMMMGERAWKREFLRDHIVNSILYQSLSLGYCENAICSILFDDLNLPPSPLVPADSNEAKKKAVFSGFHFVHQHYSILQGGGKGFRLQLPLPSWCSIQCSRFGSTTVSTLVHSGEETTCYLLFPDRHTQRATAAITEKLFVRL